MVSTPVIIGIVVFIVILILIILAFFFFRGDTPIVPPVGPPPAPPDQTYCLSTSNDSLGGGASVSFSRVTIGSTCSDDEWMQVLVFQAYTTQVPGTTPFCISTTQSAAIGREIYLVNRGPMCLSENNQMTIFFPTSAGFGAGLIPIYIYRTFASNSSFFLWSPTQIDTTGTGLTLIYTIYVFPAQ